MADSMNYGFRPLANATGAMLPYEYYTTAQAISFGMALKFNDSGKLVTSSGTTAPQFIAMTEAEANTNGTVIPVVEVTEDTVFEVRMAATDAASIAVGASVGIGTDGVSLSGTGKAVVLNKFAEDDVAVMRVRFSV